MPSAVLRLRWNTSQSMASQFGVPFIQDWVVLEAAAESWYTGAPRTVHSASIGRYTTSPTCRGAARSSRAVARAFVVAACSAGTPAGGRPSWSAQQNVADIASDTSPLRQAAWSQCQRMHSNSAPAQHRRICSYRSMYVSWLTMARNMHEGATVIWQPTPACMTHWTYCTAMSNTYSSPPFA